MKHIIPIMILLFVPILVHAKGKKNPSDDNPLSSQETDTTAEHESKRTESSGE